MASLGLLGVNFVTKAMDFIFIVNCVVIKMSFELLMLKILFINKFLSPCPPQFNLMPRNCSD